MIDRQEAARSMNRWMMGGLALAFLVGVQPAEAAGTKIKVSADQMRMVKTPSGEAARAVGNVTIEIPGEVRIKCPQAQLIKGGDGKVERVVFPGWVRIEDLRPDAQGEWKTESNTGGYYDLRSGTYNELNPKGTFEFDPNTGGAAPAK